MEKYFLFTLLMFSLENQAQSLIQSVNSGSIIASNSSVSIGEIIVVPTTTSQSNSGIIGILAQVNQQVLEVSQFDLTENIVVFPNPTVSSITFQTKESLQLETVLIFNELGQTVSKKQITENNSLDLNNLSSGIYIIQFENRKIKSFKIIKH